MGDTPYGPDFDDLRRDYQSNDLLVFAGAGVSAAAGLPGWKKLVETLSAEARQLSPAESVLEEIAEYVRKDNYIDALAALKDCLSAPRFGDAIERLLSDDQLEPPDIACAIAALAPKLRAVLTTNLDHLLEKAFGGGWPAQSRATGDIVQRRKHIWKLHGTLRDRATWVFTRADYERSLFGDPQLARAYEALFQSCPVLFVGYGLADGDLDPLLGRVRTFCGEQPPRHFALLDKATVRPHRRKQLESAGVRLILYDNPDGKHAAVAALLRRLAQGEQPPAAPRPPVAPRFAPPPEGAPPIWAPTVPLSPPLQGRQGEIEGPDARRAPSHPARVIWRLPKGYLGAAVAFCFGLVALIALHPRPQRHVLVMDSIVRRYDKTTGVTNADEIVHIIQQLEPTLGLPFHLRTEHMLVNPNFNNDDDVIEKAPALLIIHLSSFFGSDNKTIDPSELHDALSHFDRFVDYVEKHSRTTRFLVYTRQSPPSGVWEPEIHRQVQEALDRQIDFIRARSERMDLIELPWTATFHDPQIVLHLKEKLRDILPRL